MDNEIELPEIPAEKLLMEELAKKIWPLFDLKKSKHIKAPLESNELKKPNEDGSGYISFSRKIICFDSSKNLLRKGEEKPAYTLEADYSDTSDTLVVWSLDVRSGTD